MQSVQGLYHKFAAEQNKRTFVTNSNAGQKNLSMSLAVETVEAKER